MKEDINVRRIRKRRRLTILINIFIPLALGFLLQSLCHGTATFKHSSVLVIMLIIAIIVDSVKVYRRYHNHVR